jgi:hypothetical protein
MVGGAAEESGGSSSDASGQLDPPYSEAYWLKLWAFGTGRDGLGLSELQFWLLTYSEFVALKRVWEAARGIKPPLTKAQKEELAFNKTWLRDMWIKAHDNVSRNPGKHHGRVLPPRKSNIPERLVN